MSGTTHTIAKQTAKLAMLALAATLQTACTNAGEVRKSNLVAQAYNSSGVVGGIDYSRSIFSSNDF